MSSVQLNRPLAFLVSRWIFLRLLGLIYLIAFMSLAVQVTGLVGAEGILPVHTGRLNVHPVGQF